jgi:hypothetical protein
VCTDANLDIKSFGIGFDSTTPFTWRSDGGNPAASELDLRSVAAHEAGHATGGWLDGSDFGHFNDGNPDVCPVNSSRQTMCASTIFGTDWGRTLAAHDKDTFADAY